MQMTALSTKPRAALNCFPAVYLSSEAEKTGVDDALWSAVMCPELTATAVRLYALLLHHAVVGTKGSIIEELSLQHPLSERQIRRHLKALESLGWLQRKRVGLGLPNEYTVLVK